MCKLVTSCEKISSMSMIKCLEVSHAGVGVCAIPIYVYSRTQFLLQ